jgi:serine phosphatase RsbU (regulator of sigma subunit)
MGMLPGARYAAESVELAPGALLCAFSDGIPEASADDEMYGEARLAESLTRRRGQTLAEAADGVLADLRAFLGSRPADDDVTLLLARREG